MTYLDSGVVEINKVRLHELDGQRGLAYGGKKELMREKKREIQIKYK